MGKFNTFITLATEDHISWLSTYLRDLHTVKRRNGKVCYSLFLNDGTKIGEATETAEGYRLEFFDRDSIKPWYSKGTIDAIGKVVSAAEYVSSKNIKGFEENLPGYVVEHRKVVTSRSRNQRVFNPIDIPSRSYNEISLEEINGKVYRTETPVTLVPSRNGSYYRKTRTATKGNVYWMEDYRRTRTSNKRYYQMAA